MHHEPNEQTVDAVLRHAAQTHPLQRAVVHGSTCKTYAQLDADVERSAAALAPLGIGVGTPVGVIADQSLEFATTFLALWRLGAVVVPLNLVWVGRELVESMRLTDVEVLIALDGFRGRDYASDLCQSLTGLSGSAPGAIHCAEAPELRAVVTLSREGRRYPFAHDLADLLAAVPAETDAGTQRAAARPDDPCMYLPTSGSSGFPKPVIHSHASFLDNCANYADAIEFGAADRLLNFGPTYHISGMLLTIMPMLRGGTVHLLPWFEPEAALEIIERERITVVWGFDLHFDMLRSAPQFRPERVSSVTRTLIGSDPKSFDALRAMGIEHVGDIYGCSEYLSNLFPFRDRHDESRMRRSHGRPLPGVVQKIADPVTGEPVEAGVLGEICVKGPGLFLGYYKMPDATAQAMDADGFFHTGDLGFVDEAGYTYYRGRLKDTVKSGGENVSAREVEMFLESEIPGVALAQVVGLPDPRWGEAVVAIVQARPGADLTEERVRAGCRADLAGYKIPKRVLFVRPEEWAVTPTGKFDKAAMRRFSAHALGIELPTDPAKETSHGL